MQNNNLTLFKQAISNGLCNKIDGVANGYTEEVLCSKKHSLAMRTIVYGKVGTKHIRSPRVKWLIAILVAAALLLTGCSIIFRNEIREVFEDFFVKLIYDNDNTSADTIKEVYTPTYVPDGYVLENESITSMRIKYEFVNDAGNKLLIEQRTLPSGGFILDIENGYAQIDEIDDYKIYYRVDNTYHSYVWGDKSYFMKILSNSKLTNEELVLILNGIITE